MRIYIIGNGPSIKWQDLSPLKNEITIGVNWAPLVLDPDYLVWTDSAAYLERPEIIRDSTARKFCWDHLDVSPDFPVTRFTLYKPEHAWPLSEYVEDGLCRNGSSIFAAINLAYILGGNPIILVGCDFSGRDGYLHFYDDEPATGADFEASRGPLDKGTLAYMEQLATVLPELGVQIINATEGGVIERIPKMTLKNTLVEDDPTECDVFYYPVVDHLPEKQRQVRMEHEKNKLAMREEVARLWLQKKEWGWAVEVGCELYWQEAFDRRHKVAPYLPFERPVVGYIAGRDRLPSLSINAQGDNITIEALTPGRAVMSKLEFAKMAAGLLEEGA